MRPEYELIRRIRTESDGTVREKWIVELENLPIEHCCFYERWRRIHDVNPFECWDDDGYHPARSSVPRDVQILCAVDYGKEDIFNGGLHQFFGNGTGNMAPEMVEWCQRAELAETADILERAMRIFGNEYPRSQGTRRAFLKTIPGNSREEWDPFLHLDEPFYNSLSRTSFRATADRWLKDVCGIRNLRDLPERERP